MAYRPFLLEKNVMTKDLYVRNIPPDAGEEGVRKLFSVAGKVSYIHLVTDPKSGEFKGCGYVKMASEAEAKEAINCLDGARLDSGHILSVTEALPQKSKGATPSRQEAAPPKGKAAPPRREAAPTKSKAVPPRQEATPRKSKGTTPPKAETAPRKSKPSGPRAQRISPDWKPGGRRK
jgi:RNA recognition motif-containing protein